MPLITDPLGRPLEVPPNPQRIVSVVPSQTELLHDLGLEAEVAGITKFCVHPDHWFRTKPRVGGTKDLRLDRILHLQPDLVLANKEENVQAQIEALAREVPVWVSDVADLPGALRTITAIGNLVQKAEAAAGLVQRIRSGFAARQSKRPLHATPACYLIWQEPYMTVGGDTFIHSMMEQAGLQNVFADSTRYPVVTLDQIRESGCGLLLLSTEPYPFRAPHVAALQKALPGVRVLLVDGELFSWYGSRMQYFPAYVDRLGLY